MIFFVFCLRPFLNQFYNISTFKVEPAGNHQSNSESNESENDEELQAAIDME